MPIVAAVLTALGWLIRTQIGRWILTALAAIGIGFATKSAVVDPIIDYVLNTVGGVPGDIADWMGYMNIDKYITIVLSAYSAAAGKRVILRKVTGA